jgi:O-antigen/teichoic acid export membrane protein
VRLVRHPTRAGNVLVRNALALMFSTAGSAALGMAFWAVAARLFSPAEVGRASAEVASVTLLAGLAQLGLTSIFTRFLPVAHRKTGRLLRTGYAAAVALAVALSAGFLLLHFDSSFLPGDVPSLGVFAAAVVLFAVFALQDGVLTAFRRAPWVPVENFTVAALRLAMLPILVGAGGGSGVFSAWAAPMAAGVLVVSVLVFGRLVPAQERARAAPGVAPTRAELVNYSVSQYVGGVVGSVVTLLPPVLVATQLGAQQSAFFYFPWLFSTSCMALLWNIVFSLVVEAVHDVARTRQLLARAVALGGLVTFGAGVALGVGAPWVLSVIGGTYAEGGATSLRLIASSLPFTGIITLYCAVSLITKRTWAVTRLQAIAAGVLVVGSFPAMHRFGTAGMGLTFLVSRVLLAVGAIPGLIDAFRELAAQPATVALSTDTPRPDPAHAETEVIRLPQAASSTIPDAGGGSTGLLQRVLGGTIYLSSAYTGSFLTTTGRLAAEPLRSPASGSLVDGGVR